MGKGISTPITFEKQLDGTLIKTTIEIVEVNDKQLEINRLKELKSDLERRAGFTDEDGLIITQQLTNYKDQIALLESK